MKLAVAQIPAKPGNLAENIAWHLAAANAAVQAGAKLLIFPELSLTGYSCAMGEAWQTTADDPEFKPLQNFACNNDLVLIAGAPLEAEAGKPYIGSLIFGEEAPQVYRKYHLDPDEFPFFQPGETYKTLEIGSQKIGCAICADMQHESLAAALKNLGSDIYALSAFVTPSGYAKDAKLLSGYAHTYGMTVMLSNFSNENDGMQTAGKSAIWAPGGQLVVAAKGLEETILVAEETSTGWQSQGLPIQKP